MDVSVKGTRQAIDYECLCTHSTTSHYSPPPHPFTSEPWLLHKPAQVAFCKPVLHEASYYILDASSKQHIHSQSLLYALPGSATIPGASHSGYCYTATRQRLPRKNTACDRHQPVDRSRAALQRRLSPRLSQEPMLSQDRPLIMAMRRSRNLVIPVVT